MTMRGCTSVRFLEKRCFVQRRFSLWIGWERQAAFLPTTFLPKKRLLRVRLPSYSSAELTTIQFLADTQNGSIKPRVDRKNYGWCKVLSMPRLSVALRPNTK